jgi:hypothetical protein
MKTCLARAISEVHTCHKVQDVGSHENRRNRKLRRGFRPKRQEWRVHAHCKISIQITIEDALAPVGSLARTDEAEAGIVPINRRPYDRRNLYGDANNKQ